MAITRVAFALLLVGCVPGSPPEPTDDPATPGDDRPGYFVCSGYSSSFEPITCAPGDVCCAVDQPVCVSAEAGCPNPLDVVRCDGPEDCEGDRCITGTHGRYCGSTGAIYVWCHVDADCMSLEPWLPDVPCGADGTCDFSAAPANSAALGPR